MFDLALKDEKVLQNIVHAKLEASLQFIAAHDSTSMRILKSLSSTVKKERT